MLTNLYYLAGIALPSGAVINELTDCTPSANLQALSAYAAGQGLPTFRGGFGAAPAIEFTTPRISTILTACGLWGADLSAGNVDLYYRLSTTFAGRAAAGSTSHVRVRAIRSLLYWTDLNVRQGQSATIRCRLVPTTDGTNPPLVAATGAMPALAMADEFYGLGTVTLNSSLLAGVEGWSVALNPQIEHRAADGDSYPSFAAPSQHDPIATIDTSNVAALTGIAAAGTACSGLTLRALKRNLDTGLAEGTSISLTAGAGMMTFDRISGGGDGAAAAAIRVLLRPTTAGAAHAITLTL